MVGAEIAPRGLVGAGDEIEIDHRVESDEAAVPAALDQSARFEGGADRAIFEARMGTVDKLRGLIEPDDMVRTSLQYVISHPTLPVAIPGAKSVEQATTNAAAGDDELSEAEQQRLQV